jgi:hypothetical protein
MRQNMISAAVLVSLVPFHAAEAQQAVQWRVQDGGNGHWYGRITEQRPWPAQRDAASARGGHLVTLTSAAENAFVHGQFPGQAWLGGFTAPNQGCVAAAWQWVTGEPWTFSTWAPPEPNYCFETCLEFSGPYPARWNNFTGEVANRAIIEWSADCNADGIVDYGQIVQEQLPDTNGNGVPDGCECSSNPSLPACCVGNVNGDSVVDGSDLGILLGTWGVCPGTCAADFNRDGVVDGADLGVLLNSWGQCPG